MQDAAVGFVKVPVTDLARAARFYREELGLTEDFVVEEYGWAQYSTASVPICLYVPGRGGGTRTPGGDTGIQLRVADATAMHDRLSASDAVDGEPMRGDDGTLTFTARDPDGNTMQIAQAG